MAERTCSIEDCGVAVYARGWCNRHYQRWRRHGDPSVDRTPARTLGDCSVDECGSPAVARDLCNLHYRRKRVHGDPLGTAPMGRPMVESPSYSGAHMRIQYARGRASDYRCADCGAPAEDWSYRHDAGIRMVDPKTGCLYSPDPSDYEPRCKLCHKAYDQRCCTDGSPLVHSV
jgi:hypothetical protein